MHRALAGEPLERADHVAVLAAGMLLAELFPLRIPGREEETSFSTAFSFALLFSHGVATTVVVATACLVVADVARRRAPGQARVQRRAVRDLVGGARACVSRRWRGRRIRARTSR